MVKNAFKSVGCKLVLPLTKQCRKAIPPPLTELSFKREKALLPRSWLALLPILLGASSGCIWTEQTERTSWHKRFNNQAISPHHALIEVALIEQPIGSAYINHQLWQHADELIVDLDRRRILEENGLRIGQLVGAPPNEFQQLLLSKNSCNVQARIFPSGKTVPLWLGPVLEKTSYQIVLSKAPTPITLDDARFGLDVTASFASDGRTKLTFTPTVENGETTLPFRAVPEQSTWELRIEKASKKHPELSWETTLGQNQYLFIGGRPDRSQTLGLTAFTQLGPQGGVQRLLVIRNCRPITASDAEEHSVDDLIRAQKAPPLALQATLPAYRAKIQ